MGVTLEELIVKLRADTAQYKQAMFGAARTTKKSTKKINTAIGMTIAKFAGFAAAVLVARKAIRVFQKSLSDIDALAKTADFLGITTEALAGLQHLGDLTGVSMGNLQTAMMRMTRAIGEAATGAKEYLEPFERIGVDVKELLRLAPEKQMARIAEGISKLGTHTEQGAVAMEFFGRSGMRMLNLLRGGEAGFAAAEREARRFGIAVSRIDAKKVEDANDSVTRMKASMSGLAREITVGVAPAVEWLAKATTGWVSSLREGIQQVGYLAAYEGGLLPALFGTKAGETIRQPTTADIKAALRLHGEIYGLEDIKKPGAATVPGAPTTEQFEEGIDRVKTYWHKVMNFTRESHKKITEATLEWEDQKAALEWNAHSAEVTAIMEHEARKTAITREAEEERLRIVRMNQQQQISAASSMIDSLAAIMDDGSRKAFKRAQNFAYASAVVNTSAAIMQALGHADPWTGAALAAAAALTGAAQIATISRTKYGGGGGGAAAAGGAGVVGGAGAAQQPRPIDVSIGLQGERFGPSAIRELIGAIDEQLGDGVTMRSITVN